MDNIIVKEFGRSQTEFSVVFVDTLKIVKVMELKFIESCYTLLMTAVKNTGSFHGKEMCTGYE